MPHSFKIGDILVGTRSKVFPFYNILNPGYRDAYDYVLLNCEFDKVVNGLITNVLYGATKTKLDISWNASVTVTINEGGWKDYPVGYQMVGSLRTIVNTEEIEEDIKKRNLQLLSS